MTALVTGASGGIGAELARVLASHRHDLILVARRLDALEALAGELRGQHGVSVHPLAADLSQPGAADALWTEASADSSVDVLINNAGAGLHGPLCEQDARALVATLELNVVALTSLTRHALPGMLERRRGRVLNVSSVVAFQPGGAGMAAYYAAKAFVLSFTRGLAIELRGSGVTATALCPGPTRSSFEKDSGAGRTRLYRWFPGVSAQAVAEAGYRGMMSGRRVVIPGLLSKLVALAGGIPPPRLGLEVNRFLLTPVD